MSIEKVAIKGWKIEDFGWGVKQEKAGIYPKLLMGKRGMYLKKKGGISILKKAKS